MVHTLDITKEHCPMTFVRTKLKLAQIAKGDILEVLLSEGEPLNNVPRSAEEQGFKVLILCNRRVRIPRGNLWCAGVRPVVAGHLPIPYRNNVCCRRGHICCEHP